MKIYPDPKLCETIYPPTIEKVREVARAHGYAIGVHGSQKRDLDLIAAPWTESCSGPQALVCAIMEALGSSWWLRPEVVLKPNGRKAWTIYTHDHLYIDLSVMPILATPSEQAK